MKNIINQNLSHYNLWWINTDYRFYYIVLVDNHISIVCISKGLYIILILYLFIIFWNIYRYILYKIYINSLFFTIMIVSMMHLLQLSAIYDCRNIFMLLLRTGIYSAFKCILLVICNNSVSISCPIL